MDLRRFLTILNCLDQDHNKLSGGIRRSSSVWSSSEESLKHLTKALFHFSEQSQDVAYNQTSIIALDDDKLRHRNTEKAIAHGVGVHAQRNSGKAGPVILLAVTSTGLVLSAQLSMDRENSTHCALKTLACKLS
jgi:hypothetical protein